VADLKTGMRVASKVENLPSCGHARPLDSRIIRYVSDGRTDKSIAYCPFPYGRGITREDTQNNKQTQNKKRHRKQERIQKKT